MRARELVTQREATHGHWPEQSATAQELKAVMRKARNWEALHPSQKEGLEFIASKISRILNGNPECRDHWDDIGGYWQLIVEQIDSGPI